MLCLSKVVPWKSRTGCNPPLLILQREGGQPFSREGTWGSLSHVCRGPREGSGPLRLVSTQLPASVFDPDGTVSGLNKGDKRDNCPFDPLRCTGTEEMWTSSSVTDCTPSPARRGQAGLIWAVTTPPLQPRV